jgi:hypothetical protein
MKMGEFVVKLIKEMQVYYIMYYVELYPTELVCVTTVCTHNDSSTDCYSSKPIVRIAPVAAAVAVVTLIIAKSDRCMYML